MFTIVKYIFTRRFSMDPELEALENQFQADQASLLDPNTHLPLYVPEQHQQRLNEFRDNLRAGVERIAAAADEQIGEIQQTINTMVPPNPLDRLSSTELEVANARRVFVEEDISNAPLRDLHRRLSVLVQNEDRANLFLFTRYLPARLQKERSGATTEIRTLLGQANSILIGPLPDENRRKELQKQIDDLQRKKIRARSKFTELTRTRPTVRF
jgi:hypothetical protein